MKSSTLLGFINSAIAFAYAGPTQLLSSYSVKDSHHVPKQWKRTGPAPVNAVIELHIGLRQGHFDDLERHLFEISDPLNERYGQHLTADQVHQLVQPSSETFSLVHEWLSVFGIEPHQLGYSPARDWITVSLPVGKVEKLIGSEYSLYEHQEHGNAVIRTPEWSLPSHLHEHISTIQPTNAFFSLESLTKREPRNEAMPQGGFANFERRTGNPSACHKTYSDAGVPRQDIDLECIRELYATAEYTSAASDVNHVGLVNYHSETAIRRDVSDFLKKCRNEAIGAATSYEIISVNGGNNDQGPCDDICQIYGYNQNTDQNAEYLIGIGWPANLTTFNIGGKPPFQADSYTQENTNEPYLAWTNYVLNQSNIPQTISSPYFEDEQTVPKTYAQSVCNQFAQLGARGASVLVPSGNLGVGHGGDCLDSNFKQHFLPQFPASCPYVTAVGATKIAKGVEVAAYDNTFNGDAFSSGAGFSDYFPAPKWQSAIVDNYLSQIGKFGAGKFNKAGRAYPDIAAVGQNLATAWDGATLQIVDGTTVSVPIAVGVFALVNDVLLAAGKAPLGFLNPFIYAVGNQGFTDVTAGSSYGCNSKGFPAKPGWDAVTGFGTPDFQKLVALAKSFQA